MNKFFPLLLLLTSCAVNYNMPTNRFESPETRGKMKTGFYAGVGKGVSVELTPNYASTWASTTNPVLSKTGTTTLGADLGVSDSVDVGVKYISDLGIAGDLKWQYAGNSTDHGFKGALAAYAGIGSETLSESNSTPSKAELSNMGGGLDAVFGYRTGKSLLFYVSHFYDVASYDLKQTRGASSTKFHGSSRNLGGTAGFILSLFEKINLTGEYARSKATAGNSKAYVNAIGGQLEVEF